MLKALRSLSVHIHGGFYILLAFALLLLPLPWLLSWLFAAGLHEFGHMIAIVCTGHQVNKIEIGCKGAKIYTDLLGNDEWFCAMGGPLSGLMLVLLLCYFPRLGVCAFMQTVVNLMPIMPLDGGRILKSLLAMFLKEDVANRIAKVIGILFTAVLAIVIGALLVFGV